MKLDERTTALIAVGASLTANCRPCLHSTIAMAKESGVDEQEIAQAIEVARQVRDGAASKMDAFAAGLIQTGDLTISAINSGCGCNTSASSSEGKNE